MSGVSPRTRRSAWRLRRTLARIFSGRSHSLRRNHSPFGRRLTQPSGRPVRLALAKLNNNANWQRRRVRPDSNQTPQGTGNAASSGHSRCSHARRVEGSSPLEVRADFAAAFMPGVPKPGAPCEGELSRSAVCDLTQVLAAPQPNARQCRSGARSGRFRATAPPDRPPSLVKSAHKRRAGLLWKAPSSNQRFEQTERKFHDGRSFDGLCTF
jgi:hypothetical protein